MCDRRYVEWFQAGDSDGDGVHSKCRRGAIESMCCSGLRCRYVALIVWVLLVLCVGIGLVVLMPPVGVRRRLAGVLSRSGVVPLGFVLLALGMTSPLLIQPSGVVLEVSVWKDAYIGVWNLWWIGTALLEGTNPYFTDYLCAPSGTDLALHSHSVTYGLLTLPVQWVLASAGGEGLFVVYNLVLVLSFALTGYFTYRLAWRVSGHRGAALLAGMVFAFSTYRFANLSRLHVMATEWLVLVVWAAVVFLSGPSPKRLVALVGAFVLLLNASLEYTAYAATIVLALGAAELLRRFILDRERAVTGEQAETPAGAAASSSQHWIVAGLVSLGILALGAGPFLVQFATRLGNRPESTAEVASIFSADLVDLFLGNPRHPLWGQAFADITEPLHLDGEGLGQQPGYLTWILFGYALVLIVRARRGLRWVVGAIVCLCLVLGPQLKIAGEAYDSLLMPHQLLSQLVPILSQSRTPFRWMGPAVLFLAVVIAIGWAQWRKRSRTGTGSATGSLATDVDVPGPAELLAAIGVLFFALPTPLKMTTVKVPEVYRMVATAGETSTTGQPTALLQLPGIRSRDSLVYQCVHRQPLIEDIRTSVPFNNGSRAAMGEDWEALVIQFGRPGAVAGLDEAARGALLARVKNYLRTHRIRWVVVAAARSIHALGLLNRHVSYESLGPDVYKSYRENLRLLNPKSEREAGAFTLFEF